jgi:hypothetical protein
MKISTKAVSPYLNQEDVPQPIVATMDCVMLVPALRNPHVLHFEGGAHKPIPLNLTNRRALVALFGDDDANWVGKSIEIYVDPNVNDSKGNRDGGIRLRAPAERPVAVAASKPMPAAPIGKPIQTPPPKPARTLEQNLAWALTAMDAAANEDRLGALAIALGNLPLNEVQTVIAQHRYERNLQRLTAAAPATK